MFNTQLTPLRTHQKTLESHKIALTHPTKTQIITLPEKGHSRLTLPKITQTPRTLNETLDSLKIKPTQNLALTTTKTHQTQPSI